MFSVLFPYWRLIDAFVLIIEYWRG